MRVMVYSCGQDPLTLTSLNVIDGDGEQLSVAVAEPVFTGSVLAVHSMVISVGQDITGAAESFTVMT